MQIKRYEVANLQEALTKIKKDLGPDAIILSTRKIEGKAPLVEVMAARDEGTEAPVFDNSLIHKTHEQPGESLNSLSREIRELKSCVHALMEKISCQSDLLNLQETMNVLCDSISAGNASHLRNIYKRLISTGMSRTKAVRLIETIKNDFPHENTDTCEKGTRLIEKLIARSLVKDDRKERRIKAFIGPTGVGKTTTLAKLAAHYSIEKKMKVGLITTDTYRIAASEQLKVYAKIMGLPIHIASEQDLFVRSVAKFSDKDMILVDTPGRSHNDDQYLRTLKNTLCPDVESILLISPIASREYLIETADRYKIFDYDRIILTKVDECSRFGQLYDVLDGIGKPVAYMTTGQNVPKDIEKASPETLAKLILQNRLN
ncbi:MAG: flagellar biosynthesis protein FlhF [Deltaproteobacteria bacterium]|nr:flagellar biosynthesis protein FlhF [Deltaproteobacteria bacterium]